MTPDNIYTLANKRILVAATDAGAGLFLSPVIKKLLLHNKVHVLAGEHAAITFRHQNILFERFEYNPTNETNLETILQENFDHILLGTNLGVGMEKALTVLAREYGLKTTAVIDHYWHLWHRFADLKNHIINKFLPDDIWVFEHWQKNFLIEKMIPREIIHVAPHPYLSLIKEVELISNKEYFCNEMGIDKNKILLIYASEPPPTGKVNWKSEEPSISDIKSICQMIKEVIMKLNNNNKPIVHLIIKKHPTENRNFMENYWSSLGSNYSIIMDYSPTSLIQASDIVIGISSMFLLESITLGKTTATFNIKNNEISRILNNSGLQVINNKIELFSLINEQIKNCVLV